MGAGSCVTLGKLLGLHCPIGSHHMGLDHFIPDFRFWFQLAVVNVGSSPGSCQQGPSEKFLLICLPILL